MAYTTERSSIHDFIYETYQQEDFFLPFFNEDTRKMFAYFGTINRNDFMESLSDQVFAIQTQLNSTCSFYDQLETTHLVQSNAATTLQRDISLSDTDIEADHIAKFTARAVDLASKLELERIALDQIRSWKAYLAEWIDALSELHELWGDIWDWYEIGLFHSLGSAVDADEGRELINELQALKVKIEFYRKGAQSKTRNICGLNGLISGHNA